MPELMHNGNMLDDAKELIWLRDDGAISYDRRMTDRWPSVKIDTLLDCVADNADECDDSPIDWAAVERDYRARAVRVYVEGGDA